jgi:hypothetical protein
MMGRRHFSSWIQYPSSNENFPCLIAQANENVVGAGEVREEAAHRRLLVKPILGNVSL